MTGQSDETGGQAVTLERDALAPSTRLVNGSLTLTGAIARDTSSITYRAVTDAGDDVLVQECFPNDLCERNGLAIVARHPSAADGLRRLVKKFTATADKLSRVSDPALPSVLAQFTEHNTRYVVLRAVTGDTFATILQDQRSRLRMREISTLMNAALSSLQALHAEGILHGNISADTIVLDAENNLHFTQFNFLLPDAAAADQIAAAQSHDVYVAPEYVAATGLGGPRSDLYSLGAAFYQAIARRPPPSAFDRVTALLGGQADPILPLRKVAIAYRPAFRQGIDRALCISEADRPASAADWLALIRADGPYEPRPGEEFDEADTPAPLPSPATPEFEEPVLPAPVAAAAVTAPAAVAPPPPSEPALRRAMAEPEPTKSRTGLFVAVGVVVAAAAGAFVLYSGGTEVPDAPAPTVVASVEPEPAAPKAAAAPAAAAEPAANPVAAEPAALEQAAVEAAPAEPAAVEPAVTAESAAPAATEPAPAVEPMVEAPEVTVAAAAPEVIAPDASPDADIAVTSVPDTDTTVPVLAEPEPASAIESAVAEVVAETAPPVKQEAPKPIEPSITDVSAVMSAYTLVLPFTPANDAPDTIGAVQNGAEPWATVGRKIVSVDGVDVARIIDINPALRQSGKLSETRIMDIDLEIVDIVTGDVETVTTAMPVVRDIALLNGLRFQERPVDGAVQTVVTMTPAVAETDAPEAFRQGDILVSFAATGEQIGSDITLSDLMTREIGRGTALFEFAALRGGRQVNTAFAYTPNGN